MRCAVVATTVLALVVLTAPASAASFSCTPAGADLQKPTTMHFADDAVAELERGYRAPEVRGLRTVVETYLAGDARRRWAALLKATPKSILRKRFMLMSDERGLFGGFFLIVQFKEHPETMYHAWVYDVGDEWDLRAWDTAHCTRAQQRWLRIRYGELNLPVSG